MWLCFMHVPADMSVVLCMCSCKLVCVCVRCLCVYAVDCVFLLFGGSSAYVDGLERL